MVRKLKRVLSGVTLVKNYVKLKSWEWKRKFLVYILELWVFLSCFCRCGFLGSKSLIGKRRFKKWEKLVDEFLNVLGETREQLKDVGIDGVESNPRQETSKII